MKVKSIFVSMFALAALASCNNDDEIGNNGSQPVDGEKAYISLKISVPNGVGTRATNESKPGTIDEQAINSVKAIFFDAAGALVESIPLSINSLSTPVITEAFKINKDSEQLLVLVNGEGTEWTFAEGTAWTTINNAVQQAVSGLTSKANGFTMANEAGLVDITGSKKPTKNEAEAAGVPAVVKIDRLVSKVEMKEKAGGIETGTAKFEFLNWGLSITNKSMYLLSERVPYDNATTTAVNGVYRKDPNYDNNVSDTTKVGKKFIVDNFNLITDANVGNEGVMNEKTAPLYCLENTMEAVDQKKGVSTKAIIKAVFTPAETAAKTALNKGDSYFKYNGKYYNFAEFKAEYAAYKKMHQDADIAATADKAKGIWLDADNFATAANGGTAKVFDDATVTEAWLVDQNAGVLAKGLPVRFYGKSICYYEYTIKHDLSVTDNMALGRWGVVRNNWYELTINEVSAPGTPWVPDPTDPDPSDPSKPEDNNDEEANWIAISVTMNPWTFWQQGVVL